MTGPAALDTELVEVARLSEHPENYNRGDDERMADLLARYGQWRPAVVQRSTGRVLIGNTMLRAARDRLGWTSLNVHWRDVDDDEARRILVADNRARDLSTSDDRALAELLRSFDDDFSGTGFVADEADDFLALLQELDEQDPPQEPTALVPYATSSGAYGVDGDGTNTRKTPSYSEYQAEYEKRATRFLALIYPLGQYAWIVDRLGRIAEAQGVESNSDVLLWLVEQHLGETAPKPDEAPPEGTPMPPEEPTG